MRCAGCSDQGQRKTQSQKSALHVPAPPRHYTDGRGEASLSLSRADSYTTVGLTWRPAPKQGPPATPPPPSLGLQFWPTPIEEFRAGPRPGAKMLSPACTPMGSSLFQGRKARGTSLPVPCSSAPMAVRRSPARLVLWTHVFSSQRFLSTWKCPCSQREHYAPIEGQQDPAHLLPSDGFLRFYSGCKAAKPPPFDPKVALTWRMPPTPARAPRCCTPPAPRWGSFRSW